MLKKILVSVLLVVALIGIVPLLAGCEKPDEIKTHSESNTSTSETHTVVD